MGCTDTQHSSYILLQPEGTVGKCRFIGPIIPAYFICHYEVPCPMMPGYLLRMKLGELSIEVEVSDFSGINSRRCVLKKKLVCQETVL